jgi:iron-sulfur cluster insertion protein
MIDLSERCVDKIKDLLIDENDPNIKGLRVFVQGGGCSGFEYGFTWDSTENEDDFVIDKGEIKVLIDAMSMQYLTGATIDFKEEVMGSNFVITNPNAKTSCGCGSSFAV